MSWYTHSLFHTHTLTRSPSTQLQTTHSYTHANKCKNTRFGGLKERLSGIITLAERCLAFGLKDSLVFVFFGGFFFDTGMEGVEQNGIPSPRGTAKAEQCWNKWFMLLSSQVNSAVLSTISSSVSLAERWKNYEINAIFFCLSPTWRKVISRVFFFWQFVLLRRPTGFWISSCYTRVRANALIIWETFQAKTSNIF